MPDTKPDTGPTRDIHAVKPIPVRHLGQWLGGAALIVVALLFVELLVSNANMQWTVVFEYLFSPDILHGLGITLMLTTVAMILGLFIGVILAVMRLSSSRVFQSAAWGWIWFFRGVPPLVQLIFWYNMALLIPRITIALPFGRTLVDWNVNDLITPFSAAIMGLAFTESAYAAEMLRAGIRAVSAGQTEACATLGMTRWQSLRRIVLPQALRIVIPPIGNDTISMLKFSSLVSILALPDLLYSAQMIYARTYQTIPLLIVATIWYLVLTTAFTLIEHAVEAHFDVTHRRRSLSQAFLSNLRAPFAMRRKEDPA